jgi:hypothetical protein
LGFSGLLALLFLFIEEFSQVHDFADRGIGVRRHLYQVQLSFPGNISGFFQ